MKTLDKVYYLFIIIIFAFLIYTYYEKHFKKEKRVLYLSTM